MQFRVRYSKNLEAELAKYDIPFSYDENEDGSISEITVETNIEDINLQSVASNSTIQGLIKFIVPILNKPLCFQDHFTESDYHQYIKQRFFVTCYSMHERESRSPAHIEELRYKKKKIRNAPGQQDNNYFKIEYGVEVKDDNGEPIAFIAYNRIHIYFDIFHSRLQPLHKILIQDLVKMYLGIEGELKELYEEYQSTVSKRELAKALGRVEKLRLENLANTIENLKSHIESYEAQVIKSIKELRIKTIEYEAFKNADTKDFEAEAERLIEEYNATFIEDGFAIETEEIWIKNYKIGKFSIIVDVKRGTITIRNMTNKKTAYDHPHIVDGRMCFGEINTQINRLLGEGKYFEVAAFAKECLYFYNPGGQHADIDYWKTDEAPPVEHEAVPAIESDREAEPDNIEIVEDERTESVNVSINEEGDTEIDTEIRVE